MRLFYKGRQKKKKKAEQPSNGQCTVGVSIRVRCTGDYLNTVPLQISVEKRLIEAPIQCRGDIYLLTFFPLLTRLILYI